MLLELVVRNFALLDEVDVEFSPGLNVLTGETGTGKSLLMDALALVLGQRASGEVVRQGEDKATIQARFLLPANPPSQLQEQLAQLGLEGEEELILSREITKDGRSRCRLGDSLVTVGTLAAVGKWLVDIHGQHAHQSLLDPKTHLFWLDDFAGRKTKILVSQFAELFAEAQKIQRKLANLEENQRSRARELDLLRYELEEIQAANLTRGEEEELQKEHKRLAQAQNLSSVLEESRAALADDQGIIALLGEISSSLQQFAPLDKEFAQVSEQAADLLYQAQELSHTLRTLGEEIVYDPERLAFVEERLANISKLERKYGKGTAAILDYAANIEKRIAELEGAAEDSAQLAAKQKQLQQDLADLAQKIHEKRAQAAEKMAEEVSSQLAALRLEKATFKVQISPQPWDRTGGDRVEMLMAPNPGEGLAPLAKIASGGEISRIMLALKCVLAEIDKIGTLIFDEIDTGIGGRTLQAVAERLSLLGQSRQVICVTHAPQIASMADNHFAISKESEKGRTKTKIRQLAGSDQVEELARMLGGAQVTDLTRGHAKEMLRLARERKQGIKQAAGGHPTS
ncbi:MAG TPA: DNA repair protein RecN [Bacillota bacterium]|nr:DNA repair protein RecN [Bacillota bacterium]